MFNLISKCAKLEYPTEKSDEKRFIDWVNDVTKYDKDKTKTVRKSKNGQLPYLNGELSYKIRYSFVHDLSLDIQGNLGDNTNNTLVKQENIQFMVWKTDCLNEPLTSSSKGSFKDSRENRKSMHINICGLINKWLYCAEQFIKEKTYKHQTIWYTF